MARRYRRAVRGGNVLGWLPKAEAHSFVGVGDAFQLIDGQVGPGRYTGEVKIDGRGHGASSRFNWARIVAHKVQLIKCKSC